MVAADFAGGTGRIRAERLVNVPFGSKRFGNDEDTPERPIPERFLAAAHRSDLEFSGSEATGMVPPAFGLTSGQSTRLSKTSVRQIVQ